MVVLVLVVLASLCLGRVTIPFLQTLKILFSPVLSLEPDWSETTYSVVMDVRLPRILAGLLVGLKEAGKKIGARYPITFYQNFSPSFPPAYEERARKWGIL